MHHTVFLALLGRIQVRMVLQNPITTVQDDRLLYDQRETHWQHLDKLRKAVIGTNIGMEIHSCWFFFVHAEMAVTELEVLECGLVRIVHQ